MSEIKDRTPPSEIDPVRIASIGNDRSGAELPAIATAGDVGPARAGACQTHVRSFALSPQVAETRVPGVTVPTYVLTEDLRSRLFAFILSRVGTRETAEDLTQETLLRAGANLAKGGIDNIEGWLFRVARNAVTDHFRRRKDHVQWQESEHGEATHESALTKEEESLREQLALYVREVVNGLPGPYREALLLTEYQGLTQKELAAQLGLTVSAAKSRVQRGRAEVRRTIERCCQIATDPYGTITDCEPRQHSHCGC
jgi:RNA polymerase sigma-70 factor (ECF subfamily)